MKIFKNIKPEFTDARGDIFKLLDDGKTIIKSVLLITCKPGAIRANHYHKTDSHYCYMLYGKMEYTEGPLPGKKGKNKIEIVEKGDMVYTAPNVPHAMKFLEDSAFLTLATESRSQKDYESDTVRLKVI